MSSSSSRTSTMSILLVVMVGITVTTLTLAATATATTATEPIPAVWPEQFHSILVVKYKEENQIIDLWYDWPNGRNFNIIQRQLGDILYDLEWNNGSSFYYTDSDSKCSPYQFEVGILRPNWLDGATYLGQRQVDGFLCNAWEKADFIVYYEDVVSKRPVSWVFYTGRTAHVMTFEVGAVLEDAKWQVPAYCFDHKEDDDARDTTNILKHIHNNGGAMRGSMQLYRR